MFSIRRATPHDIPIILNLIRALACYERQPDAVVATESDLFRDGFGEDPIFSCLIAEIEANEEKTAAGFALYFHNYSTWQGRRGIHIEDLFVLPEFRGQGIGKALLCQVASQAVEEQCGRLAWDVLDWNQPAIDFYERMGARMLSDWRIMRVTDEALSKLASSADLVDEPR
jgi:GNAT superfamily N-acetyltransferase